MSEYQGLNLPELLELLQPVVVPDPPSLLPETEGWWVVAGWLLTLGLLGAISLRQRWRANAYRREAQAEIDGLLSQANLDDPTLAAGIAAVVKRTALAAYPRTQVASLSGDAWAAFLESSSGDDPQVAAAADLLANAAYRVDIDPSQLIDPARRWISAHRV